MDDDEKIKVFSNSESELKLLGELLSNETSRKIIVYLISKQAYTNQIAKELNIPVGLVVHHLQKIEKLGLVEINEKKIVRKGKEHRYFRMIPNIFVMPGKSIEEIKEQGILKKFFKTGVKYSVIGLAGIVSFFIIELHSAKNDLYFASQNNDFTIPLLIVTSGLIMERILSKYKKRKKAILD